MYKLALPEIHRLQEGYEITQDEKRRKQEEQYPELRKKSVRESDKRTLKEFKDKHNLD